MRQRISVNPHPQGYSYLVSVQVAPRAAWIGTKRLRVRWPVAADVAEGSPRLDQALFFQALGDLSLFGGT